MIIQLVLRVNPVVEDKLAFKLIKTIGHCSTVHGKFLIVLDFLVTTTSTDKLASKGTLNLLPLSNKNLGGRNSSVGSAWARCPQRSRFDPPLGTFSSRGDFSLGVNMGSNSIPPKTLSDESINRGLVCAHMHFIAQTQKILTFMS